MIVAVLKKKGYKVQYVEDENGWNGSDENIIVNGEKLWDFIDYMDCSLHDLLKDHIFMITRQFDIFQLIHN